MKLIAGASIGLAVVSWIVVVVAIASIHQISLAVRLLMLAVLLVVFGSTQWLLWSVLRPSVVRADAIELSFGPWIDRQRMQRSDLELIFRGQTEGKGRARGVWSKSYVFAAADGTVGLSCNARLFTVDGMEHFAQRLQVPIKGDFSVKVKDKVDVATA